MRTWIDSILHASAPCALPIMTHPGIEMIGRTVTEASMDGRIQAEAIDAIQSRFSMIAAPMMMDLTIEAEAFGSTVAFAEGEVAAVSDAIVSDLESVGRLRIPDMTRARVPQVLAAAAIAVQKRYRGPVLAGCIGPFTLASRLFGMSDLMVAICMEPATAELLVQKCTAFLIEYIRSFKALKIGGVIMAEPAAGLLSEDMCQDYSSNYIRSIVTGIQDDSFSFILHNCGNPGHLTHSMISTEAAGLHFGNTIDILEALREVPSDVLVFGNLDPVGVFRYGSPKEVGAATTELLRRTEGHQNFVLSSGCDIPPNTPVENIDAFFRSVSTFDR